MISEVKIPNDRIDAFNIYNGITQDCIQIFNPTATKQEIENELQDLADSLTHSVNEFVQLAESSPDEEKFNSLVNLAAKYIACQDNLDAVINDENLTHLIENKIADQMDDRLYKERESINGALLSDIAQKAIVMAEEAIYGRQHDRGLRDRDF